VIKSKEEDSNKVKRKDEIRPNTKLHKTKAKETIEDQSTIILK
jgi:hypothetical protein